MAGKFKIDWKQLAQHAGDLVLKEAASSLPGEEKLEAVVNELIRFLDDRWEPKNPIAEAFSDLALGLLRGILRGIVQEQFDLLRGEGLV